MKNKKIKGIHSLKFQLISVIMLMLVILFGISLWTIVPLVETKTTHTTESYLYDLVNVAGSNVDEEVEADGFDSVMTPENIKECLAEVKMRDMETSYAYVVAADGTMLYHPTEEKIGNKVENAAVSQLVQEIQSGVHPDTVVVRYEYQGTENYAACYVGDNNDFILVVTVKATEALRDIQDIILRTVIAGIGTQVICFVLSFFIANGIVNPIRRTTDDLLRLSNLDFTETDSRKKNKKKRKSRKKRQDEATVMQEAIQALREQLKKVLLEIQTQSTNLLQASVAMSQSAGETLQAVDQVDRAIGDIADGANSQAAETQTATENIIAMGNMIEETSCVVTGLRENSQIMGAASEQAVSILHELALINQQTKDAIQTISVQTDETNQSADRIKEAIDIITNIAEETNLLSLNASIEAARAGEMGRGFAVVASQIQKLAEQSAQSAQQVTTIANALIQNSEKSVAIMEDVRAVINKQDENVRQTETAFQSVQDGIQQSVVSVQEIEAKTRQLDELRTKVVDVVQSLTAIAQQNAASTQETSASAAQMGTIMSGIADQAGDLNGIADALQENVDLFKMS